MEEEMLEKFLMEMDSRLLLRQGRRRAGGSPRGAAAAAGEAACFLWGTVPAAPSPMQGLLPHAPVRETGEELAELQAPPPHPQTCQLPPRGGVLVLTCSLLSFSCREGQTKSPWGAGGGQGLSLAEGLASCREAEDLSRAKAGQGEGAGNPALVPSVPTPHPPPAGSLPPPTCSGMAKGGGALHALHLHARWPIVSWTTRTGGGQELLGGGEQRTVPAQVPAGPSGRLSSFLVVGRSPGTGSGARRAPRWTPPAPLPPAPHQHQTCPLQGSVGRDVGCRAGGGCSLTLTLRASRSEGPARLTLGGGVAEGGRESAGGALLIRGCGWRL